MTSSITGELVHIVLQMPSAALYLYAEKFFNLGQAVREVPKPSPLRT